MDKTNELVWVNIDGGCIFYESKPSQKQDKPKTPSNRTRRKLRAKRKKQPWPTTHSKSR